MKKLSAILVVCFMVSLNSNAQQAIILYNNVPVRVELEGDKIKSFIGEAPKDYMKGYQLSANKNDFTILAIEEQLNSKSDSQIDNVVKVGDHVEVESQPKTNAPNASYSIISKERITLEFNPDFATLNRETLQSLDMIARRLKEKPNEMVLLTSHVVTGRPTTKVLSNNRVKAAKTYLKLKGVPLSKIKEELLITDYQLKDTVYATYLF